MKMSNFESQYSPEDRHMICIGKTKLPSEKCLFKYLLRRFFVHLNENRKKLEEHKTHFQELKKYCLQKSCSVA